MTRLLFVLALFGVPAAWAARPAPMVDHHQHLLSQAYVALHASPTNTLPTLSARELIANLDAAGIRRALVLSLAYSFGSPNRPLENEYAKVRAENDWTAAQVAQYPDRLRGFCGFNPLKDYALAELARCARIPQLRHGIKLHFGNSDVQLDNPEHVARLRKVFAAANASKMAIAVHMRASIKYQRPYGESQGRVFLEQLLPMAPDVQVQVAHLAGTGPGYDDPAAHSVMAVLAAAVERRDPRTRQLWFDVASVADEEISPELAAALVTRLRQVGVDRVLYGSDATAGGNLAPREAWAAFRRLPMTEKEFARIATNVAPYMR
ncbi:MAG TPA: amidohydrolase family protein [Telluria sp.]